VDKVDELSTFVAEMVNSPGTFRVWKYAERYLEYYHYRDKERIVIYSGELYGVKTNVLVNPVLFWLHSRLLITEIHFTHPFALFMEIEKQNEVLKKSLSAMCSSIKPAAFYDSYHQTTNGRLPRALEEFAPVEEAMCMENGSIRKIYLAKTNNEYLTFYWEISI
jgi:hypothetical protein